MGSSRPGHLHAPWTLKVVDGLNEFQTCGYWHPFTCPDRHHHPEVDGTLYATVQSWRCRGCEYRQYWAHDFMADREWIAEQRRWHEELISNAN